jgi:hypothetical protein
MSEHSFESALAECLAAIDAGASVEDALARFPAHIESLQPVLGLRAALDARGVPLPPTVRARGEQRLQAALAGPAAIGGIPVLSRLLGLLPKAATQALIALVVTGGAIGASAAAGGPNVPGEVLQAVGLRQETADENSSVDSVAKGKAKKAAATGTATASAELTTGSQPGGASENALKGLCNAYTKGGLGQNAQPKGQGTPAAGPLQRLDEAAGSESVEDYCADLLESEGKSKPSSTSTAESGNSGQGKGLGKADNDNEAETPAKGKSSEAPGKSQ